MENRRLHICESRINRPKNKLLYLIVSHRGVKIAIEGKANTPEPGKQKDFKDYMNSLADTSQAIQDLKKEVLEFSSSFPLPGV